MDLRISVGPVDRHERAHCSYLSFMEGVARSAHARTRPGAGKWRRNWHFGRVGGFEGQHPYMATELRSSKVMIGLFIPRMTVTVHAPAHNIAPHNWLNFTAAGGR
jgi:hypothetical protein